MLTYTNVLEILLVIVNKNIISVFSDENVSIHREMTKFLCSQRDEEI